MLSKCLNPLCSASFRYLHEGRIFNIEKALPSCSSPLQRQIEHFWLCPKCSRTLKVVLEGGRVTTRPRHIQLPSASYAAMV